MKIRLSLFAMLTAFVFVGFSTQITHAEEISCETNKEETCFGDADFAFINRQLPSNIGKYDTNGGYPEMLATAPQYYYQDRCGMENRTSESYAVFRYMQRDVYLCPFLQISANQWIDYALAHPEQGYVLSDVPQVGAIAISDSGLKGHAAYVEEITPDGVVRVSQYDLLPGSYSESTIKAKGVKYLINSPKGLKGA